MTADERIASMKARQAARVRRDQEEERRRNEARLAPKRLLDALATQLEQCGNLVFCAPEDGRMDVLHVQSHCPAHPEVLRPESRTPWLVVRGYHRPDTVLIRFEVAGDFEAGDVYLTHDGDRVTPDQAVDLALAAIERCLYGADEPVGGEDVEAAGEAGVPF